MDFSEKIYALRKDKGYTQEQLAEQLDVSRQSMGVFHFMPAFLPCFCQGNQHDPFIPFVSASEDKAIIFQLCKLLRKGLRTNGKMVCQCSFFPWHIISAMHTIGENPAFRPPLPAAWNIFRLRGHALIPEGRCLFSSFASCSERDCGRMARWSANAV